MQHFTKHFLRALGMSLVASGAVLPAVAQTGANVTVSAGAASATVPAAGIGVNTAVWDGNLLDAAVPGLLQQAGVTALRFPGGSTSDVYHWQTNSATGGQYVNPNDTFDAFMGVARKAGASPIITVNYGSNAAGNAGGDPNEAAAWVDYANNTKKYGVKYWEVGNEVYGNGEYGAAWEEDLHTDHSPTAYGNNVAVFANAMKAKDSTVKVGAVLTAPGNWPDGQTPDWNSAVLTACGSKIDFVIVHWYAQGPGGETDAGLLASTGQIAAMVAKTRALVNQYCGANAPNIQIFVTETNSVAYNPGKQTVSLVNALFLADDYQTWLENGVGNVDWWDLFNGPSTGNNNSGGLYGTANYGDYGLLSSGFSPEPGADTPFPAYFGLQMLSHLERPGDQVVSATSSQPLLATHAVKQANGDLALLLINKDPANSYAASVSLSGYAPASSATVYVYGENSATITSGTVRAGTAFTVIAPPYSLTTVLLTPSGVQPPPVPTFSATATASPAQTAPGGRVTFRASVTDTGAAVTSAVVDLEVYNSAGIRVGQTYYSGQQFTKNGVHSYTWTWTAPTTPGAYTLKIGVFNANWSTDYYWNGGAAGVTVAGDSAQYSFENGTQGWASSGGMISGIAGSTAQAFAGTQSLAVSFHGSGADAQQVFVASPSTPAGKTVTFHIWVPAGSAITAIQPYVQQGASGGWAWTGNWQSVSNLKTGAWNTLTVAVPANAQPLIQLGVQFFTSAAWTGTAYVDSVGW